MGVVTDVTVKGLTTAVTNISNTGMSDTTGQAIVSSINNLRSATSPIITDDTGQAINTTLQSLVGAISPSADNVSFDNTGTPYISSNVEDALKELSIFAVEQKSFPIVYSSSTNPVSTNYYDVSKTGYTALGVLSWAVTGSSSTLAYVNACAIDSNVTAPNRLYFSVRVSQQGTYNHTLYVKILYVKNS